MIPHDANKKLGLNVTEPALWNGFTRPAFLLPTDSRFNEIASLYYKELEKLFGKPTITPWTRSTNLKMREV